MPLLDIPVNYPADAGVLNTYVKHSKSPFLVRHLFLLCDRKKLLSARQVNYKLKHHDQYVDSYIYGEYEMLVYELEEKYAETLELFYQGAYSKFSTDVKTTILNMFVAVVDGAVSKNFAVLYPNDPQSSKFKTELEEKIGAPLGDECELISVPDIEKETFKLTDLYDLYDLDSNEDYLQLV